MLKLIENAHLLACVLSTVYLYIPVYIDVCIQVLKLIENAHMLACVPSTVYLYIPVYIDVHTGVEVDRECSRARLCTVHCLPVHTCVY